MSKPVLAFLAITLLCGCSQKASDEEWARLQARQDSLRQYRAVRDAYWDELGRIKARQEALRDSTR